MSNIIATLMTLAGPYLVGVLTKFIMNLIKNIAIVDDARNGAKRLLVVLISTVLTTLAVWAGVHVVPGSPLSPSDAGTIATAVVTGLSSLLSAVYAMAAHAGDKASPNTPST